MQLQSSYIVIYNILHIVHVYIYIFVDNCLSFSFWPLYCLSFSWALYCQSLSWTLYCMSFFGILIISCYIVVLQHNLNEEWKKNGHSHFQRHSCCSIFSCLCRVFQIIAFFSLFKFWSVYYLILPLWYLTSNCYVEETIG